jgi:membrane protease YdiL (CAAX protease family)
MSISSELPKHRLTTAALFVFFALTFLITWGLIGGYIFWPEAMIANFGEISGSHPFFFIATWAPAIAAFTVVLLNGGLAGLKGFLSRLFLWRCPVPWWVLILVVIPLVFMAGSLIKGGPLLLPLPSEGVGAVVGLMFMMLLLGPIEEFGWRGVAQPILQRYMAPIWAGALIGVVWGVWHLPAFFLAGVVFAEWSFLPFFIGNITLAILVTPIFNATKGSLALPMLFHWQLINPFWPDAQPWDTWLLVVVAAIIVWWKRDMMFSREGAVTEVIPGEMRP